jgi:hypothetical protein
VSRINFVVTSPYRHIVGGIAGLQRKSLKSPRLKCGFVSKIVTSVDNLEIIQDVIF